MDDKNDCAIPVLHERMLAHLGGKADAYPSQLEQRFPRILAKLVEVWGRPEGDAYLNSLLVADRADRTGFPGDVASELFRLSMIHGALRAKDAQGGGWLDSDDSEVVASLGRRAGHH
jgi:hypothetical protein